MQKRSQKLLWPQLLLLRPPVEPMIETEIDVGMTGTETGIRIDEEVAVGIEIEKEKEVAIVIEIGNVIETVIETAIGNAIGNVIENVIEIGNVTEIGKERGKGVEVEIEIEKGIVGREAETEEGLILETETGDQGAKNMPSMNSNVLIASHANGAMDLATILGTWGIFVDKYGSPLLTRKSMTRSWSGVLRQDPNLYVPLPYLR